MKFIKELLKLDEAKSFDQWSRDMSGQYEDPYSKKNFDPVDSDFRKKRPGFGSKGFTKPVHQNVPKIHLWNDGGPHDWKAVDENTYDGAPDGNNYIGHGDSKLDAIYDLCEELIRERLYTEEECSDGIQVWKHENR